KNKRDAAHDIAAPPPDGGGGEYDEGADSEPAHVEKPAEQVVALVSPIRPAGELTYGFESCRRPEHGQRQRPNRLIRLAPEEVLPADDHGEARPDHGSDQWDHVHRGQ